MAFFVDRFLNEIIFLQVKRGSWSIDMAADTCKSIEDLAEDPYEFLRNRFRERYTHLALGEDHSDNIRHQFMVSILPRLKRDIGLKNICLELESKIQKYINLYLETGNEKYLKKVIDREKELVRQGYPVEGRINGNYFDIIRIARNIDLPVIAMDSHDGNDDLRDSYMASNIPNEGPTLIYVGEFHLITGLIDYFEFIYGNPNHFSVFQQTPEHFLPSREGFDNYIQNSPLKGRSFAFNFTDPKTIEVFLKEEPFGFAPCGSVTPHILEDCKGLICHYQG